MSAFSTIKIDVLDADFDTLRWGSQVSCTTTVTADPVAAVREPPLEPEKRMILAMLLLTLQDATMAEAVAHRNIDNRRIRDEARAFIYSRFGATATWFRDVCDIAGYSPDYIRRVVDHKIKTGEQIRFAQVGDEE